MHEIPTIRYILLAVVAGCLFDFTFTIGWDASSTSSITSSKLGIRKESAVGQEEDHHSLETELERVTQKWIRAAPQIARTFEPSGLPIDLRSKSTKSALYEDRRPLVFFHQRKAGGTSIRKILEGAAQEHDLSYYIPCINPSKQCRVYTLPLEDAAQKPNHAIYGGHLFYSSAVNTLEYDKTRSKDGVQYFTYQTQRDDYTSRTFDCFTNIRDPLNRVVSSWNYRQIHNGALPSGNMTASEWDRYLPLAFSEYGYGNNNEAARLFGGISSEREVNTLTSNRAGDADAREPHSVIVAHELDTVLSRIATCVIYSQDRCEDSKKITEHFFPWLDTIDCSLHLNTHNNEWTRGGLQTGAAEIIKKHNLVEFHAYNFSVALFNELLAVVDNETSQEG